MYKHIYDVRENYDNVSNTERSEKLKNFTYYQSVIKRDENFNTFYDFNDYYIRKLDNNDAKDLIAKGKIKMGQDFEFQRADLYNFLLRRPKEAHLTSKVIKYTTFNEWLDAFNDYVKLNKGFHEDNPYYKSIKEYLINSKLFKSNIKYEKSSHTLTINIEYGGKKIGILNDITVRDDLERESIIEIKADIGTYNSEYSTASLHTNYYDDFFGKNFSGYFISKTLFIIITYICLLDKSYHIKGSKLGLDYQDGRYDTFLDKLKCELHSKLKSSKMLLPEEHNLPFGCWYKSIESYTVRDFPEDQPLKVEVIGVDGIIQPQQNNKSLNLGLIIGASVGVAVSITLIVLLIVYRKR